MFSLSRPAPKKVRPEKFQKVPRKNPRRLRLAELARASRTRERNDFEKK
jgi:hypothetical protein